MGAPELAAAIAIAVGLLPAAILLLDIAIARGLAIALIQ